MRYFLFALWIFFVGVAPLGVFDVRADDGESSRGYMWGGSEMSSFGPAEGFQYGVIDGNETGLGWISMNSSNCDINNIGQSNGGGSGCPSSGTPIADYGVHIPLTDGDLHGYAWSENVGWISFQNADLGGCPSGICSAYRLNNEIYGWARILGIRDAGSNSGGWVGWIKLHADAGDPFAYGMTVAGSDVNGYSWSDEFGWIKMYDVTIVSNQSLIVCPAASTITVGGTLQLRAYYHPTDRIAGCSDLSGASDVTTDASTSWISIDSSIVSVDGGGIVTGIAPGGPVHIDVRYNGTSATSVVSVNSTSSICGNGVIDSGESCDGGFARNGTCNTGTPYDHDSNAGTADITCSASCQINTCQCQ